MKNNNNDNFLISLASSVALHLLAFYLFLVGFPSIFTTPPNDEQIISFEMLPVAEISNIPTKKSSTDKIEEPVDAKKVQASKAIEEPIKSQEEPKSKGKEPELKNAEVVPIKKKEEIKPKKEPSKELKQETKLKEKTKPKKQNDDLESLLKNLEKSSKGDNAKSTKHSESSADDKKQSKGSYNENLPLSISEKGMIKQQIEKNWKIPIGAQNIDQIKIIVYISLNKDGSVSEVKVTDKICNGATSSICDLIADSCTRAVWQSSPIQNLPEARYDTWKAFNFLFDPSDMIR